MIRYLTIRAAQIRDIINSREFQRLRHIAQLGFTPWVYPGANHSRLSHSLGAFQCCQKALRQLRASGIAIRDEWYDATALAALLHDIGHGPFSHSFEKVTIEDHEERTVEIIRSGPEIFQIIRAIGAGLSERIIQVLTWSIPEQNHRYLSYLVNSQLDCDRLDYLRRDSLHSGAGYGQFDRDWLLRSLRPSPDQASIVLAPKGKYAAEQYLIGRFHMYQCVYFHKTTRAFESAFLGLCLRLRRLNRNNLRDLPEVRGLGNERLPLADYIKLTDFSYLNLFQRLADDEDPTVRLLSSSIIYRKPMACEERVRFTDLINIRDVKKARATQLGLDPECIVLGDEPSDTPYKPYEFDPGNPDKSIRILSRDGRPEDITRQSNTVRALMDTYYLSRLYFPRELV